jgi:hypothetical protein
MYVLTSRNFRRSLTYNLSMSGYNLSHSSREWRSAVRDWGLGPGELQGRGISVRVVRTCCAADEQLLGFPTAMLGERVAAGLPIVGC